MGEGRGRESGRCLRTARNGGDDGAGSDGGRGSGVEFGGASALLASGRRCDRCGRRCEGSRGDLLDGDEVTLE